jgi:hypothetical protein
MNCPFNRVISCKGKFLAKPVICSAIMIPGAPTAAERPHLRPVQDAFSRKRSGKPYKYVIHNAATLIQRPPPSSNSADNLLNFNLNLHKRRSIIAFVQKCNLFGASRLVQQKDEELFMREVWYFPMKSFVCLP